MSHDKNIYNQYPDWHSSRYAERYPLGRSALPERGASARLAKISIGFKQKEYQYLVLGRDYFPSDRQREYRY